MSWHYHRRLGLTAAHSSRDFAPWWQATSRAYRKQASTPACFRVICGLPVPEVGGCWLLRLPPGASFWQQARLARLPSRLLALIGGHAVQYLLWLLAWWAVGQGALQGRLDRGWLLAWALLLVTLMPCRLLATWAQGRLAIGAGGLLKQRLL